MAPAPRPGESKAVQVTKLSNQISRHFKKCGLRKAEFKRQKSLLIEKELQAHFKAKHESDRDEFGASRPATSPPASPTRSASSPAFARSPSYVDEAFAPQSPGKVATRFAASHPAWMHPCVHPGAASDRPASQIHRRQRLTSDLEAVWSEPQAEGPKVSSGHHTVMEPLDVTGDSFVASTSTSTTKFRRPSPKKRTFAKSSGFGGFFQGPVDAQETEEDRLFGATSWEEELFQAADAEAAALRADWGRGVRPRDPPDMIERLGDLMALLGPRYRTLPREALWEKAVVGSTTPLQRKEKRLGPAAYTLTRSQSQSSKNRTNSPEWLPDYDPDGAARAKWLQARERENEKKAKATSLGKVSTLGPSMHLPLGLV
ncbi:unnamed protein product [Effrenium voratum]|uniref:Uncharacterized protein n=1 Tax=Effrenium voratum TaxID=2562239 RepID=A0AA36MM60_9DINO|nr:unnamed protein product [Effrenium voratum]CAJ1422592.1 unnamed protein product [Effrenium voratum]